MNAELLDPFAQDFPESLTAYFDFGHATCLRFNHSGSHVAVGLVEEYRLLDDRLIVLVQRNAAGVVSSGALEAARLDLEAIVPAAAVRIDPRADGITQEARLDVRGPVAPVGEDATIVVDVLDQDVGRVRRDHELHLAIAVGDPRHAR